MTDLNNLSNHNLLINLIVAAVSRVIKKHVATY